jgi:hypothetical protein
MKMHWHEDGIRTGDGIFIIYPFALPAEDPDHGDSRIPGGVDV